MGSPKYDLIREYFLQQCNYILTNALCSLLCRESTHFDPQSHTAHVYVFLQRDVYETAALWRADREVDGNESTDAGRANFVPGDKHSIARTEVDPVLETAG